ncbi:MAG: hypothetical protein DDT40_01198 [candidate division WS2 bacterium]|nr:hypothetical protein [Candidatus Psychracetigena formicireducens]
MATTVGLRDDSLAAVARRLWDIGRNQSRVLTVSHAGGVFSNFSLGAELAWTDFRGATGAYTIFEYETVISRTEYKTSYRAYVKI